MNRRVIIPLVALFAAGAAASWYFGAPQRFFDAPAAKRQLTLYGNVDVREVQLAFRVAGRIKAMAVDEGDSVRVGEPLAALDDGPLAAAVRGAQANVAALQAALDKAIAGPRPAEIDQAKAQCAQLEANLKLAELTLGRTRLSAAERRRHAGDPRSGAGVARRRRGESRQRAAGAEAARGGHASGGYRGGAGQSRRSEGEPRQREDCAAGRDVDRARPTASS